MRFEVIGGWRQPAKVVRRLLHGLSPCISDILLAHTDANQIRALKHDKSVDQSELNVSNQRTEIHDVRGGWVLQRRTVGLLTAVVKEIRYFRVVKTNCLSADLFIPLLLGLLVFLRDQSDS